MWARFLTTILISLIKKEVSLVIGIDKNSYKDFQINKLNKQ